MVDNEVTETLAEMEVILGPRSNMKIIKQEIKVLVVNRQRTRSNLSSERVDEFVSGMWLVR